MTLDHFTTYQFERRKPNRKNQVQACMMAIAVCVFQDFVRRMLQLDPKKRLTESQALNHPWVKGVAAKSEHMPETHNKIKEFNATRKMKVTPHLVYILSHSKHIWLNSYIGKFKMQKSWIITNNIY